MRRTHATLSLVLCSTMVLACGPAQGPSPAEAATQTPAAAAVTPVLEATPVLAATPAPATPPAAATTPTPAPRTTRWTRPRAGWALQQSRAAAMSMPGSTNSRHRFSFEDANLATSHFDVQVTTQSVNSQDSDRDTVLRDKDLFDSTKYPTAHFVTSAFTRKAAGQYEATGKLTIRDVTHEIRPAIHVPERAGGWQARRLVQGRRDGQSARLRCRPGRLEGHLGRRQRSESQVRVAPAAEMSPAKAAAR